MNTFTKTIVLTAAIAATTLSAFSVAEARDRYWRGGHHHGSRDGWVAGAAGLAAGVIVGSAIANSDRDYDRPAPRRVYVEPDYYPSRRVYAEPDYYPARRVYRERPVAIDTYAPWTDAWYQYCSDRYRSFNSSTGTFRGYDGLDHFCVAGG